MEITKHINPSIQGLRGYAMILIFLSHSNLGSNNYNIYYTTLLGAMGVSLFLILSGYLLLERHHAEKLSFGKYFHRKLKKIYPLHMITLLIAVAFSLRPLLQGKALTLNWISLILNAFLIHSFVPNSEIYYSFNAVSWYLSVNLFLICVSPLVLRFWKCITKNKHVLLILFFLFFIEIIWCYLSCFFIGSNQDWLGNRKLQWLVYIFPLARLVDFLIGGGVENYS